MEKVKNITEKTRIVTVVINVKEKEYYGFSKKNNPNVHNWVVNDDNAAKELVKRLVWEIKKGEEDVIIKSKRIDGNHYRVFFGDNYDESVITWDFNTTTIHE